MRCSLDGHARCERVTWARTNRRLRPTPRAVIAPARHQKFIRPPGVHPGCIGHDGAVSRRRPWRPHVRATAVAGLTLPLVVALAACDDASGRASLDPRTSLERLEALRAFRVTGVAARGVDRGTVRASYGTRPTRAIARAPVDVGTRLARVEVRRIGSRAWVRRAVVLESGIASGTGVLALRAPGTAPFLAVDPARRAAASWVVDAYDPRVLLRRIVDGGVRSIPESGDPTAATGETSYTLRPNRAEQRRTGLGIVTITTTRDGTPTRITYMTSTRVRAGYRIRASRRGPRVVAPAAAAVDTGASSKPLPDATADYTTAGRLTAGSTAIEIRRAPGPDGWSCWKVESDPGYRDLVEPRPSGGTCVAPLDAGGDPADAYAIPLDATSSTSYELLAFLVPAGSTGTARFADGSSRALVPTGDLLVAGGAAEPPAVLVTLSLPGATLVCGPGPVSDAGDLDGLAPAQAGELRDAPWNCLPVDAAG